MKIKVRAWDKIEKKMFIPYFSEFIDVNDEFENLSDEYHVMLYSNILDKNDIEIYDGDIVKCNNFIKYVTFRRGAFVFNKDCMLVAHFGKSLEVIGNIYENKDILES